MRLPYYSRDHLICASVVCSLLNISNEIHTHPYQERQSPCDSWFVQRGKVRVKTALGSHAGCGQLPTALACRRFSSGTMTSLFITRIFEEHAAVKQSSADGDAVGARKGMDFTSFLDFSLAWDHRSTPPGIRYFFPVLDMNGRGYITQVQIRPHLAVKDLPLLAGKSVLVCVCSDVSFLE